jgi:hypothetical protein
MDEIFSKEIGELSKFDGHGTQVQVVEIDVGVFS